MKRLISLLVVFAMVMSLVPVTFAEEAGVKITYDPSIFGFNQNIADISYENTSGFFSYHSRKDGWNPAHGDFRTNGATDTMGMVAHHHTAGDWYAIELNVPAAGDYDVSIQCVKRTYGSNKAYLYFLDSEEAKDIEANLTEENKFSENSFYDTGNYVIDEYAEGTVSFASSGKYLLVVQGTENWTYTSIGKIVLDGGNGTAVMGAVAKITDDEISVGEKSQIDVSAYRSDGGEIMLYPDEKSFESSDESIVMVDQNGVITALSEGDAKITATVSWNGKEYKSTASISVVTKTSDVKVFYDFIDNFTSDVPYTTGELTFLAPSKQTNFVDTYEKTFGFWKFASAPSGLSVNHCYSTTNARNNGFRAYFYNDKNWFAINVRVPVTDTYDVVLGYDVDISFDNELKVHILNGEASDTVIAESIANGTGLIGSVNCTTGKQDGTQKATLGKSQLSAGEHTVVFYAPNSKNIRLHSLSLSAGSGEKSAIMSADMSLSPSGKLSVSGILSDEAMSNADMSTATVKYTGQNPDIATVSADGTVEVLTAGKLTVAAEIIYGEQTLEIQKSFDVAEKEKLAPSETVQFYDFMKVSPDWLSPMQTEGDPRNEDIRAITYGYTDGNWQWHSTDETSYSKPRSDVAWVYQGEPWGRMRLLCGIGQYIALTVKVPQPGRYFAELEKKDYHSISAEADLYIIPMVDEANVQRTLAANESLGHVNCLNRDVADYTVVSQDLGVVEFETAGEYLFVVKKTHGTWGDYINLKSLTLDGRNIFKLLTLESDTDAIHMGEAAHLDVTAALLDGTELDASELNIRYTTSDADVATVSRNGVVTGLRDGTVTITAIVTHNGETHSASKTFDVIDASGVKRAFIDVPESIYVTDRKQAMLCIEMNSGYIRKIDPSLVRFEVVSQNPSNAASIDSFGYITANKEGTITLSANTWFDGARRETEEIKITLLPSGKKSRTTIYTQEMRDTAIANSQKYDWAKSEVKAAKELADRYVDLYGSIYSSVTGKGLPTSRQIGGYGDPEYMICRYCGVDTSDFANGGNGRAFTWDIINRPWKIQCPGCKRVFPSNDFESFYNLGLDKNGLFDRDRALEEHEEIFGGTYGTGYLKNTLYPELADTINNHRGLRPGETVETWGVDDGWGYVPKDADGNQYRYANGKGERHPYIAYYNYFAWGESRREILEALKTAYIYTGDIKYGRAGAIILDRIADVWPDMDSSS